MLMIAVVDMKMNALKINIQIYQLKNVKIAILVVLNVQIVAKINVLFAL